jgi:hypothetical protein
VVFPAKVTTVPAFKLERLILLLVGTAMSRSVIWVQAATAGAICQVISIIKNMSFVGWLLEFGEMTDLRVFCTRAWICR